LAFSDCFGDVESFPQSEKERINQFQSAASRTLKNFKHTQETYLACGHDFVKSVQSCHSVTLGKGGIVESIFDEIVDGAAEGHHHLPDVNDSVAPCPMAWMPKSWRVS
jgi:hypothetical protein